MKIFEKRAKRLIEPSFRHGIYLDYWSFVHVFSGLILGLLFIIFELNIVNALVFSFILAVLYKVFEVIVRISEDIQNVIMDIVLVTFGTYLAFAYFIELSSFKMISLVFVLTLVNIILTYTGRIKYIKNKLKVRRRRMYYRKLKRHL